MPPPTPVKNPLRKRPYTFKTVDKIPIQAEVYRHNGEQARPVLVWIHGGALIVGSRSAVPSQLLDLCRKHNYILVSIDYRLAPEVKLPAIADDVVDAIGWVRKEGPGLFHADPERRSGKSRSSNQSPPPACPTATRS